MMTEIKIFQDEILELKEPNTVLIKKAVSKSIKHSLSKAFPGLPNVQKTKKNNEEKSSQSERSDAQPESILSGPREVKRDNVRKKIQRGDQEEKVEK